MKKDFYREEFAAWLARVSRRSPPRGVVAYYVGLFETPEGCTAYLVGSREFDPEDDGWACDDFYAPREKYLPLPEKVDNIRDARRVRRRVARAVEEFLAAPENRDSFLARAEPLAVGFDDGDLLRVK